MEFFFIVDIVRHSMSLVSYSLPVMLLIIFVLVFPVSSIILSHTIKSSPLPAQLISDFVTRFPPSLGVPPSPLSRLFFEQLSQTLASRAMCLPINLTLWMLAKSAIFYILSCRERGKEPSVNGFLKTGPRIWSRTSVTYIWGCMLLVFLTSAILTLGLAGTTLLHFVSTVFEDVSHAQSLLRFILDMSTLFVYAVLLAPSVVIFNMGCVVAGMEDPKCGSLAFLRSLSLLKGRRLQPALLLFLIMNAPISFMEVAFQYRVLRGATMTPDSLPALGLLEAPFLIFCHSFLLLFDSVVSVSFYRACQLEADTTKYCSDMEDADEDQFSIAIHLVEQRCRTMISIADSRPK